RLDQFLEIGLDLFSDATNVRNELCDIADRRVLRFLDDIQLRVVSAWPSLKTVIRFAWGFAAKSLAENFIASRPPLNSRLAPASQAASLVPVKARPTSISPEVKAIPMATKPRTGRTAMAAMR